MKQRGRKNLSRILVFMLAFTLMITASIDCLYAGVETKQVNSERSLVEAFVGRLYSLVLGRDGEAGGIKAWTDALLAKESNGVDAGYGFVFSDECINRNLSNEAYVEMLYRTFMDREPDAGGRDAWVSQLAAGVDREQILFGFIMSDEFRGICETYGIEVGNVNDVDAFAEALAHYRNQNADITKFVARCYQEALGRDFEIDGLEAWCKVIIEQTNTPTEVAQSFIFSEEFISKGLSNEEYVKVLYRTFMGREADGAGLQAWVNTLEQGTEDRESIVMGFSNSVEFAKILYSFGLGDPVIEDGYHTGEAVTGEIVDGVYIIRSADDPAYALTVVEDRTAEGGYNLVMSEIDGGNNQKFLVVKDQSHYLFMSMAYYDENGQSADKKWFMNSTNGGWGTPEKTDNLQVTSDSIGGAKTWKITETESGTYMIQVIRGDNYQFYVTAEGTVGEGSNAGMAERKDGANQKFNFVHPYTQSLADGTYGISPFQDSSSRLAIKDASVKDHEKLVTADKTEGTEQFFNIQCVDDKNGLYTIQNTNSQRYMYLQGSVNIGAPVSQVIYTGAADQKWYIQKNMDGTYSFISANSGQYLTYTMNGGKAAAGAELSQTVGKDSDLQKFNLISRSEGPEVLGTGVYEIAGQMCRLSSLGQGIYNICLMDNRYFSSGSAGITYADGDTSAATKWRITSYGDQYAIQSVLTEKYMTGELGLSSSEQAVAIVNRENQVVDYNSRYDLSVMSALDTYSGVQILDRVKMFGLSREDLMNPVSAMNTLETEINSQLSNLPTETVEFTGNTVKELNTFLRDNSGKVVKLTQDIQVYIDESIQEYGVITLPANTILDGDGHSLVMKDSGSKIPDQGIMFYYFDAGWNQTVSSNCGVRNLKSEIPYGFNTVNVYGADNILIEGCTFFNAGMNAIVVSDRDNNNDPTINGIIRNNILGNTKQDTIGVYGDNSRLIISGNTVNNSGEYGIMLSCLRYGEQTKVSEETFGPHDIIVKDNVVTGSAWCAMYCLGAYRAYITGNTLCDSVKEGICLDSGCIGCYFANNEVYGNSKDGGLPGVSIDNSIYNIIDGNNIHDNACNGIKLVRTALGNVIVNNTCVNNAYKTDGNTCAGISIEAVVVDESDQGYLDGFGSDCNIVINNIIGAGHNHGIMISNDSATGTSARNIVKYNKISADYDHGTVDFSSYNNIVKDNIIQ